MPNLSKFKRLVWLRFMFPIEFFHTDKNFPSISPLEKLIVAKILETSCKPLPSQVHKNVSVAKSICGSSRLTVSVEDLKFSNNIWKQFL